MMLSKQKKIRQGMVFGLMLSLFFPVVIFSFFSSQEMSINLSWNLFIYGLLFSVIVSIGLILGFNIFEEAEKMVESFPEPLQPEVDKDEEVRKNTEVIAQLTRRVEDANQKEREARAKIQETKVKWLKKKKEVEELQSQYEKVENEHLTLLQYSQEQLKKKDLLLAEYAQTVNDLRSTMESKQQMIEKLEGSVSDLSYDVNTLLQLSDLSSIDEAREQKEVAPVAKETKATQSVNSTIKVEEDAEKKLRKCIDIAQKLTSSHFSSNSRFQNVSIDHFALDQRRLYDSFRSETSCLVILYTFKEGKVVFVNDKVQEMLGWSPENFIDDFDKLLLQGVEDWRIGLGSLNREKEVKFNLVFQRRDESEIALHCHIGKIPTGVFKNFAIAILHEQ